MGRAWGELVLEVEDLLEDEETLVGYFETHDLDAAREGMAATEVNARWQAEMAEFFVELDGLAPDVGFLMLDEVFHLEDQLPGTTPDRTQKDD